AHPPSIRSESKMTPASHSDVSHGATPENNSRSWRLGEAGVGDWFNSPTMSESPPSSLLSESVLTVCLGGVGMSVVTTGVSEAMGDNLTKVITGKASISSIAAQKAR